MPHAPTTARVHYAAFGKSALDEGSGTKSFPLDNALLYIKEWQDQKRERGVSVLINRIEVF